MSTTMEIPSPRTYHTADAHAQDQYPAPTNARAPILVETGSPLADRALQADIKALARLVLTHYGVPWRALVERDQSARVVRARDMLTLLWHVELGLRDPESARLLGRTRWAVGMARHRLADALCAPPVAPPAGATLRRQPRRVLPPPHTAYRLLRAEWARLHIDSSHAPSPTPPAPERSQPLVMRSAQDAGGSAYGVGGGGAR